MMKKTMKKYLFAAIVAAAAVSANCASANDLGNYGDTFEIIEADMLKLMLAKLNAMKKAGTLDKFNQEMTAKTTERMERPDPIGGIHTTTNPRSWMFDPSFVVTQDIADQKGQVFAHRGDVINPLERLPTFNQQMIFIDAREPKQVSMALALNKKLGAERLKIILTAGQPLQVMRKSQVYVYYDQRGLLTTKFGITQVPATVKREGNKLRIDEVKP